MKKNLEQLRSAQNTPKKNMSDCTENIHIFVDCHLAILAIPPQNNENYHHLSISIRINLFDISTKVKSIKIIYCPAHKRIKDKYNEWNRRLTCKDTKKAKYNNMRH